MRQTVFFLIFTLGMFLSVPALAGGPLGVTDSGSAMLWINGSQIPYNPDQGTLGVLSQANAQKFVADCFAKWANVPTSSVGFVNKGQLPVNVTKSNYTSYLSKGSDGRNPIVFDSDGSIIDDVYGAGSSDNILGYAAPWVSGGKIVEGESVLNGRFVGSAAEGELFKATLVHEFGHYIGLDHTQINSFAANNGNESDDKYLPTMYPTATDNDLPLIDLNADDIAWVSELYPSGGSTLGAIEGSIRTSGGSNLDGINVIARRANDPLMQAISCVSGYKYPTSKGFYRIPKITAGRYTVGIDRIMPEFTAGSSVGPFDPPAGLTAPPEFYNGISESSNPSTDKPDDSTSIRVGSGAKVTGINITLNSGWPTPTSISEQEPNSTMAGAQVITGSRRISGTALSSDVGELSFSNPEDDIEDIYFLQLTNAANISVKLDPTNNTADLDLIGFFPSTVIFASERHFPETDSGNETFGPIEIGREGAYVGVSYWDAAGAGSFPYTLTINVSRFPIGIEFLSPASLKKGSNNQKILVNGSGFSANSKAAFSGMGITVHSVKYISYNQLELTVSVAASASPSFRDLTITSAQNQVSKQLSVFEVQSKPSGASDWDLYQ